MKRMREAAPTFWGLPYREQRFVREFLFDLSVPKAAARVGISENAAKDMLVKHTVRLAMDELMQTEAGVTRSRILQELGRIAFVDPTAIFTDGFGIKDLDEMTDDARAVIAGMKQTKYGMEIKLHSKLEALSMLAKIAGMLKDGPSVAVQANIQTNVNVGVMIAPEVASEEDWEARMREAGARDAAEIRKLTEAQGGDVQA